MEAGHRRAPSNRTAVSGKVQLERPLAFRPGRVEVDEPDGLLRGAATRPRNPGHCERDVRPQALAHARRHRSGGLTRDRAVPLEQLLPHAQLGRLDLVRIGDDRAPEDVARARHRRQPCRHEAARARLRDREAEALVPAQIEHDCLHRPLVPREQVLPELIGELVGKPVQARPRIGLREQIDVDLEIARADRGRQPIALSPSLGQGPGDGRLARAVEAQHAPLGHGCPLEDPPHRFGFERRAPEPLQLGRRPGQHHGHAAARVQDESRRGAGDSDHARALDERRLLAHALGEVAIGPAQPFGNCTRHALDLTLQLGIDDELAPGRAREQLHGAVVVRRPETARDEAELGLQALTERRFELDRVVADDHDPSGLHSQPQEFGGEKGAVPIRALAADELAAGDDDDPARAGQAPAGPRTMPARVRSTVTEEPPPGTWTTRWLTTTFRLDGLPKVIQRRRAVQPWLWPLSTVPVKSVLPLDEELRTSIQEEPFAASTKNLTLAGRTTRAGFSFFCLWVLVVVVLGARFGIWAWSPPPLNLKAAITSAQRTAIAPRATRTPRRARRAWRCCIPAVRRATTGSRGSSSVPKRELYSST